MKDTIKSLLEVIVYFFGAVSLAIIISINLSVLLIHFNGVGVTSSQLMGDYLRLIYYLQSPWVNQLSFHFLAISKSALEHFSSVRHLILSNELVSLFSWGIIAFIQKKEKKRNQLLMLISLINYVSVALLIFVSLLAVNFNSAFIKFHQLIFRQNNWVFNPKTDPIILAMPSDFFLKLFCLCLLFSLIILYLLRKHNVKQLISGQFRF